MSITKICDGYYYGTQADLKPLLLGGAEEDAIYCAVDTGAVYKGGYPHIGADKGEGAPCMLRFIDRVTRQDNKKILVNTIELNGYNLKRTSTALSGKKFKVKSMIENLLIKNNKFDDADNTNGYTRHGSQVSYTNEQTTNFLIDLNVYYDEVPQLAFVVANNSDSGYSSGLVKLGYIDGESFVEIKSASSCSAGSYKCYRRQGTTEATPHKKLAVQLTGAIDKASILVADERYASPYSDLELSLLVKYDAICNIFKKGTINHSQSVMTASDVEFWFEMESYKADGANKFTGFSNNRYTTTPGEVEDLCNDVANLSHFEFTGKENTAAETAAILDVFGIAEVEF